VSRTRQAPRHRPGQPRTRPARPPVLPPTAADGAPLQIPRPGRPAPVFRRVPPAVARRASRLVQQVLPAGRSHHHRLDRRVHPPRRPRTPPEWAPRRSGRRRHPQVVRRTAQQLPVLPVLPPPPRLPVPVDRPVLPPPPDSVAPHRREVPRVVRPSRPGGLPWELRHRRVVSAESRVRTLPDPQPTLGWASPDLPPHPVPHPRSAAHPGAVASRGPAGHQDLVRRRDLLRARSAGRRTTSPREVAPSPLTG
jgi:hypothetical protein